PASPAKGAATPDRARAARLPPPPGLAHPLPPETHKPRAAAILAHTAE
ncbi:alpha/beta hydrolase, partial [Actinomadura sp. WAC 06369]